MLKGFLFVIVIIIIFFINPLLAIMIVGLFILYKIACVVFRDEKSSKKINIEIEDDEEADDFLYFKDCYDMQDLRKRYKELCVMLHPDNGGDEDLFQQMQAEYEEKKQFLEESV